MINDTYKACGIGELICGNPYVGRGIVTGLTKDGAKAVAAYFIMGRSENSRNRIFVEEGENLKTHPYDASKVVDPSLIIYYPIRKIGDRLIVTNGDQTDTISDFILEGKSFAQALETREFEPDAPNFTPRISAMLDMTDGLFKYEMSILKSADEIGSACNRFTFSYSPVKGIGHFIHTYETDGNPIPTFRGEPERISVPDRIDELTEDIWNNLNDENKISLYVKYIDIATGETQNRMINKNLM